MSSSNSSRVDATEFILLCLPGDQSWWKGLLSAGVLILFLVALFANLTLLLVIRRERRLHEPMYYLLCLLSVVDLNVCFLLAPQTLGNIWFDQKTISAAACFVQVFLLASFIGLQSAVFMVMAYDRYVAICKPLQYPLIMTNTFILKAAAANVGRHIIANLPMALITSRLHYCASNVIEYCFCENLSVASLACDNDGALTIYVFIVIWFTSVFDIVFIVFSYCMIIGAVVKLRSRAAVAKAFKTCASHLILISYFYGSEFALVLFKALGHNIPNYVHTLLALPFSLIPQLLNPLVYGLRTKEIREGVLSMLRNVIVNGNMAN